MKGLILAGGHGTRLRPITHTRAKQLVPIANKPIIHYAVESMVNAGIVEIGVIVGHNGDDIKSSLGDGNSFGAKIEYIFQSAPLGLADCVKISHDFLLDDDFVMYLGDNMIEISLSSFVENGLGDNAAKILLYEVADPHRFGVAQIANNGKIAMLVEKPKNPPSNLALVGVYLFSKHINTAVTKIKPSQRGELEITDAIQWLIDSGLDVDYEVLTGWWIDTGKKDSLLECNRLVIDSIDGSVDGKFDDYSSIDGRVMLHESSIVRNSRISGPVVIGKNVLIENSYVGPYTAIGDECKIVNSGIENSVVMENSQIYGINRLMDSLIGARTQITPSKTKPLAIKLMVGDDCVIETEQVAHA